MLINTDQSASLGEAWAGSALFPQAHLCKVHYCILYISLHVCVLVYFRKEQNRTWTDTKGKCSISSVTHTHKNVYRPCHAKTCLLACADREVPDHPAHLGSLIRAVCLLTESLDTTECRNVDQRPEWLLISCAFAGWSKSAHFVHVWRHFFARCSPYDEWKPRPFYPIYSDLPGPFGL